jgi:hypothetical protein
MSNNTRELFPENSTFGESKYRMVPVREDGKIDIDDDEHNEVVNLGEWKAKHVVLKQNEFAIQGNRMLSDIFNNTKNYRYEKQIDDIEKFNSAFRHKRAFGVQRENQEVKQVSTIHSRIVSGEFKFQIDDDMEYTDGNGYLDDPNLKNLREGIINEVAMGKTARLVLGSKGKKPQLPTTKANLLSKSAPNLELDTHTTPNALDQLEGEIDNVCTLTLIESLVKNFKTFTNHYSLHQMIVKAEEARHLLRRTIESIKDKEDLGPSKGSSYEDIRRCEEAHMELIKIQKSFEGKLEMYSNAITRQLQKKLVLEKEIATNERARIHQALPENSPKIIFKSEGGSRYKGIFVIDPGSSGFRPGLIRSASQRPKGSLRDINRDRDRKEYHSIDLSNVLPEEYRRKSKVLEDIERIKENMQQTQNDLAIINMLMDKTARMLAKIVKAVIKSKNFGPEGFLSLAAKTKLHAAENLNIESCNFFDANFVQLFNDLKDTEVEIIREKEFGPKRVKAKINLDRIFTSVGRIPIKDPIKRGKEIVKAFLRRRELSCTGGSVMHHNSMAATQALFRMKHEKPYKLDQLYDKKDAVVKEFIQKFAGSYKFKDGKFSDQLYLLLGNYAQNFSKLVSLKI